MKDVILVEDDQGVARMFERAFRLNGYTVELFEDGDMAWKHLSTVETLPTCVIMDVMMPKMSGIELVQHIRADVRFAGVTLVVLTNSLHKSDETAVLNLGADLYLVKIEHQAKQIVEKVEEVINKHTLINQ
jgi:DNA-binding response OmpR family regulator